MHCAEHLAGRNCVHHQIHQIRTKFDEFVCNQACRCLHSITLALLIFLRTPASTNRSGLRRSAAGDQAPELARPGRQVAEAWHRRGCPAPCPPSLPRRPLLHRPPPRPFDAGLRPPGPPPTPVPEEAGAAQTIPARAREAAPLAELTQILFGIYCPRT